MDNTEPSYYMMRPDMSDPDLGHVEPYEDTWGIVAEEEGGIIAWVGGTERASALVDILVDCDILSQSVEGPDPLLALEDARQVVEAFRRFIHIA